MKRFWLILLTLGLIAVFSTSALAVDVKFSGSFYAAGMYQDKTTLTKSAGEGTSTAFYYQRLRVQTDLIVSPGLKLVTRFDALERSWGATRSAATTSTYNTATGIVTTTSAALAPDSAGTRAENENIVFDWAYVDYTSPIGQFKIGYLQTGGWGTEFGNNTYPTGIIYWGDYYPKTGLYFWAQYAMKAENSYSAINNTIYSDRDNEAYMIGVNYYGIKGVEVGFIYEFDRFASNRDYYAAWKAYGYDYGYVSAGHMLGLYSKAKFGPVRLEAEVNYAFGDWIKFDGLHTGYQDIKLNQLQADLKVVADFGPAYVGGTFAYVQGDDPGTTDTAEAGWVNGGRDFQPCLILFNWERNNWAGAIPGYNASTSATTAIAYGNVDGPMQNAWFLQILAGVKPIDKLDIKASLSYATADKKPTAAWLYNEYGYELDLTATYKITNNLSYMLGGGYLFTGKYFKGTNDNNEVRDNYLVLNKLTLTF